MRILALLLAVASTNAIASAPAGMVTSAHARFTVITPECIRLEYSAQDAFIDEPSLFASDRMARFPGAKIDSAQDGSISIDTGVMKLSYHPDGKSFNAGNLSVVLADSRGAPTRWTPAARSAHNLGGTLNSLDHVTGSVTPIDGNLLDQPAWTVALDDQVTWARTLTLTPGVLSRDGWFLLDDSARMLIGHDGWAEKRPPNSGTDWYFFGYGTDYKGAIRSLTAIGGPVPLPRRYTLGSWYSRFWPYSSNDYLNIIDEFRDHGFPLDMIVLDMDWHRGTDPTNGQAYYTGYSWNPTLFPDPADFLKQVHKLGLHVTLNDHPGDGVRSWEDRYADFARAIGEDPASERQFVYDGSSPKYISAFFDILHDPTSRMGADFWWVDWMGDGDKPFNHMDWVNELYFRHSMTGNLRGQGFSRWADWGDHRHPMQFSGDIDIDWPALKLEVPFTATSGNSGAFFWTHDIGGFAGTRNPELFARWAQFGAFSAALRLHSTRDANLDKRPWTYEPEIEDSLRTSFQLRAELFPYTYSMAWKAHAESLPLLRPLYLEHPLADEAYRNPQEYLYGDAFLVAPITDPLASGASQTVWFPPGRWYHWFTGEEIDGPATRVFHEGLDTFPLFARGGTPIPMQPYRDRMAGDPSGTIRVALYPGDAGQATLYEDDGVSRAYESGAGAKTALEFSANSILTIEPDGGKYNGQPPSRDYVIELRDFPRVSDAFVVAGEFPLAPSAIQQESHSLQSIRIPGIKSDQALTIQLLF